MMLMLMYDRELDRIGRGRVCVCEREGVRCFAKSFLNL